MDLERIKFRILQTVNFRRSASESIYSLLVYLIDFIMMHTMVFWNYSTSSLTLVMSGMYGFSILFRFTTSLMLLKLDKPSKFANFLFMVSLCLLAVTVSVRPLVVLSSNGVNYLGFLFSSIGICFYSTGTIASLKRLGPLIYPVLSLYLIPAAIGFLFFKGFYAWSIALVLYLVVVLLLARTLLMALFNLESAKKELNQLTADKLAILKFGFLGHVSSGIAHEINNPLAIIMGNVSLLEGKIGSLDPGNDLNEMDRTFIYDRLAKIGVAGDRIKKVVHSLQVLTKTEASELRFTKCETLMKKTFKLFTSILKKHSIDLSLVDEAPDALIKIDEKKFSLIVFPILDNSIMAITEKKQITATNSYIKVRISEAVWNDTAMIVIDFEDNGVGIRDPEQIFVPFYTTRSAGVGAGLGLSTAASIILECNGRISVTSNSNPTVITVHLPLHKAPIPLKRSNTAS